MFGTAARTRGFGLVSLVVLLVAVYAAEKKDNEAHHVGGSHILESPLESSLESHLEKRDVKGPAWNYEDKTGPDFWKNMYPKYCSGLRQSPIDINTKEADLDEDIKALEFDEFYDNPLKDTYIKNNGHSVVVYNGPREEERTFTEGGFDDVFEFEQLHFHWGADSKKGSEHTIDGKSFPMEMHLVHRNRNYKNLEAAMEKEDGVGVLAVLFKVSDKDNEALYPIIDKLDDVRKEGETADLDDISLDDLLPNDLMPFYTYEGSLTTPPCNEVVTWVIFKHFATISEKQLEQFRNVKESDEGEADESLVDNFRPPQPLNGRVVEVTGTGSSATTSSLSMATLFLSLLVTAGMILRQ